MRSAYSIVDNAQKMEDIISVCCGSPHESELPQTPGEEDILMDVYSDILNMPREEAAGRFHHQYSDELDYVDMIH
jgi:hypothetical protein